MGQPPPIDPARQAAEDAEHLRLLSIFHYVVAGLVALFGCLPIFHFLIGFVVTGGFLAAATRQPLAALPALVAFLFMLIPGLMILCAWSLAAATVIAGRRLTARIHYTYCLVVAGILCAFMPFGTVLGVFTLIVLMRPSVKAAFGEAQPLRVP